MRSLLTGASDKLDWDSKTYHDVTGTQDGSNQVKEEDFRDQFRPLNPGDTIRQSCTLLDKRKRIEALYLRNAIGPERLVSCHNFNIPQS